MSEPDALSLDELEHYGRVYGAGTERRALCPFCGDEHKRDMAHASLAFNADTGAWTCHRCGRSGLLREHWAANEGEDPLRPERSRRKKARARSTRPFSAPPPEPSPAELAEEAAKRARLRRLWAFSVPIGDASAIGARTYLQRRGIPLPVAEAARVRYSERWGSEATFVNNAVLFPMQNEAGKLVAAEGRFLTPPAGVAKAHSAGTKSRGVFVATPGALEAVGVAVCEGPITALSLAACGFPALALCGHVVRPWLVRRLALRTVFLALDYGEQDAEGKAAAACRALAVVGATPYRLAPPAGAGDWNDYLQAKGLEAMRAELAQVLKALHCG